jgi:hypothetical protein
MAFELNDCVCKVGATQHDIGFIVGKSLYLGNYYYSVKWTNGKKSSGFDESELVLYTAPINGLNCPGYISIDFGHHSTKSFEIKLKVCECGMEKHGFANHSTWCPKHA